MRQEDGGLLSRRDMAVLVTGATGFIGSHVVRELLERGYSVKAGARKPSRAKFLLGLPGSDNLEIVQMDLFDVDSLRNAVGDCKEVIHCAAALHVGAKNAQKDVVDPSIKGVENLCSVMGDVKRVVHTSSVAAIRSTNCKNGQCFDIDDWCGDATLSSNPYGLAKVEAEKKIRKWAKKEGVFLVTIHPSIVFGPILHERHAEGSMSYLKHFVNGPPFVLDINVNFVDVRDVALAHVNALENGINERRYLIHNKGLWMKEIGLLLRKEIGGKWPIRKLPRVFAYLLAVFHPKLSVKQLRNNLGKYVEYDVKDSFEKLGIERTEGRVSIIDGIRSLQAQG